MDSHSFALCRGGEKLLHVLGEKGERADGQTGPGADGISLIHHQFGGAAANVHEKSRTLCRERIVKYAQKGESGLL
jgi:hypothetical protein